MFPLITSRTALVIIDVQQGFDELELAGQRRNNPQALGRIVDLLDGFRAKAATVIHVRHESRDPRSPFRQGQTGFAVKEDVRERPGEAVIVKHENSAFIGTDLESHLRRHGIDTLVIVGATTNHCVETTTRMAGNLRFKTVLVRDATWTFDRQGVDGELFSADQIHAVSLANLKDEFAEIAMADDVVRRLSTV
jgi:nicotinamidase-related amidase